MADTAADLIASLPPEALEGLVDSIVPPARQKVRQYGTKLPLKQGIRQVGILTTQLRARRTAVRRALRRCFARHLCLHAISPSSAAIHVQRDTAATRHRRAPPPLE